MMDAGVPLKAPVAGVAMGLIMEGEKYAVLTDILGDEDHLGDMDFKVCGTNKGITAIQMDIKIAGLKQEIMSEPVYFTVRYPHRYDSARVLIDVENPADLDWRIGIEQRDNETWSYALLDPDASGSVIFDLSQARVSNRSIRFIIAVEDVEKAPFIVDAVYVDLERDILFDIVKRKIWRE